MFRSNDAEDYKNQGAEDTVIGSTIKIEGDLASQGSIIVEGEVSGTVKTDNSLRVGEKAKVSAEVNAREAFISGTVNGNITVLEKIELSSSAVVNGNIKTKTITIASGAIFNGNCSMDGSTVSSVIQAEE